MFEGRYEVWDRVTSKLFGCFDTEEEAREAIAGPYEKDFLILDSEEFDDAA